MIRLAITERGWWWDIRHCLWLIWALTTVLGFVSFLYIGSKAKKRKWVYWGVGYLAIPIIGLTGALISPEKGSSLVSDILIYTASGLGLFCLGHAIFVVPEYLRALDFLQTGFTPAVAGSPTTFPLPGAARSPADATRGDASGSVTVAVVPDGPGRAVDVAPVNINTADADSFTALPGMSEELAAQAVELRASRGSFSSVDELCEALGLDAESATRLKPEITCEVTEEKPSAPYGRKVDY